MNWVRVILSVMAGPVLLAGLAAADNPIKIDHQTNARLIKLAKTKAWQDLLHYQPKGNHQQESQVDDPSFFLTPTGKYEPLAELQAFYLAYLTEQPDHSDGTKCILCRLPARCAFLQEQLAMEDKTCSNQELQTYLNKQAGHDIAVVFASYYISNPASIFGHSFIIIMDPEQPMVAPAINFSAHSQGERGLAYLIKGLTGGYQGRYDLMPFYDKKRDYNDIEQRDLWLYVLDLDRPTAERLWLHLWELMHLAYYDYYFLTENCSYHLISLIQAAIPDRRVLEQLKSTVVPVESLQTLVKSGLIKKTIYVPSPRTKFLNTYAKLNTRDQTKLKTLTASGSALTMSDLELPGRLLQGLQDYYDFKHPTHGLRLTDPSDKSLFDFKKMLRQQLMATKTLIGSALKINQAYHPSPPHQIHGSRRWGLAVRKGAPDETSIYSHFRLAYHDFTDPVQAFPLNSVVEFLKIGLDLNFSDNKEPQLRLQELTLFHLANYTDWSFYQQAWSWEMAASVQQVRNPWEDISDQVMPQLSAGLGISKLFNQDSQLETIPALLTYAMAKVAVSYMHEHPRAWLAFGIGPQVGCRFIINVDWRFDLSADYLFYSNQTQLWEVESRLSTNLSSNLVVEAGVKIENRAPDLTLGILTYF